MALKADLEKDAKKIFRDAWSRRKGTVIPFTEDIGLGNDGVELDAAVLYADLTDSTSLVRDYKDEFAAEIYKCYLRCAAKIIRAEGGSITSFDGDRIMAVYIGKSKCTSAIRTALKINYTVSQIINPALRSQYENNSYSINQIVGVDTSKLLVVRGGIRGSNDLLWIGNAANRAAKLCSVSPAHPTWITKEVYDVMDKSVKYTNGESMWTGYRWNEFDRSQVYASTWIWEP